MKTRQHQQSLDASQKPLDLVVRADEDERDEIAGAMEHDALREAGTDLPVAVLQRFEAQAVRQELVLLDGMHKTLQRLFDALRAFGR